MPTKEHDLGGGVTCVFDFDTNYLALLKGPVKIELDSEQLRNFYNALEGESGDHPFFEDN